MNSTIESEKLQWKLQKKGYYSEKYQLEILFWKLEKRFIKVTEQTGKVDINL